MKLSCACGVLFGWCLKREIPKGCLVISRFLNSASENEFNRSTTSGDKSNSASFQSTLNLDEAVKFAGQAVFWWDEQGFARGLHSMNTLRVPLIRDGLLSVHQQSNEVAEGPFPLQGFKILDVGCGGGILSEALARLGAEVTGLDPVGEILEVARLHVSKDPKLSTTLNYRQGTTEELADEIPNCFDAVVASEVIEHVDNPEGFVNNCATLVKPGGSLFFTTINRTLLARLGVIQAAENILKIVPAGTHFHDKFVKPEELISWCERNDCNLRLLHGMMYNPFNNKWSWSKINSVQYALHAVKNVSPPSFSSSMDEDVRIMQEGTPNLSSNTPKTSVN